MEGGEALTAVELVEQGRARPGQEIVLGWGDEGALTRLIVDA